MRLLTTLLLAGLPLAACDMAQTDFPVRSEAVSDGSDQAATNVAVVRLSADNVEAFSTPRDLTGPRTTMPSPGRWRYRVGPGDVLDIVVYDHPELTVPAGTNRTPLESGLRVDTDGAFYYPYVGKIAARGRTPDEIRAELMQRLDAYIKNPQVEVRVVGYNAQAISVTGEVHAPQREPLTDMPLTLLDAINGAGGLSDQADPRAVMVRRGSRSYTVDLQAFLDQGISANNPVLINGDVVSVPRIQPQEAYLLGQIVKPSTIDLTHENVTLTQALTRLGGLREGQADARGVFVFRATEKGVNVYQLVATSPTAFLTGTRFILHPQDVVYVTTAPLAKWNRLISNLLPSVTSARALNSATH
jgi:polysaccharide export outer membrane protein